MSNIDKLFAYHDEWVRQMAPKPCPGAVKLAILAGIGINEETAEAPACKKEEWLLQLSFHTGAHWDALVEYIELYKMGQAKGQKKATKHRIEKTQAEAQKMVEGGMSPTKAAKQRRPAKKQKRMNFSSGSNVKSVAAAPPKFEDLKDINVWKMFQGMHDTADQDVSLELPAETSLANFKLHLFSDMAKGYKSLDEAATKATQFKALTEAKDDFIRETECSCWDQARRRFPYYTTDEQFDSVVQDYMSTGTKTIQSTKSRKKISQSMDRHIKAALGYEKDRNNAPTEDGFVFKTLSRGQQLDEDDRASGMKPEMKYLIVQACVTTMLTHGLVPKLDYRLAFMDLWYEMVDGEGMSLEDFKKALMELVGLTTSPIFTLIVFCGHAQCWEFMKAASSIFDFVEKIYWFKPNAHITGLNRHANNIEEGFVCYLNVQEGSEKTRPSRVFFKWFQDPEESKPANSNVYEFNKVTKPFKYDGDNLNEVLNDCQKPLALCENLVASLCIHGTWALDLCAGSGSFAVAALRASLNVVAVDKSKRQCMGMESRFINCLTEDANAECAIPDDVLEEEEEEEAAA